MNAPLPEHLRQALANVTLDDKYTLQHGMAFMSGVQALVRLPMLQQERWAQRAPLGDVVFDDVWGVASSVVASAQS